MKRRKNMDAILSHLSSSPISINKLSGLTGLTPSNLLLALAGHPRIASSGDGLILVDAPEPQVIEVIREVEVIKEVIKEVPSSSTENAKKTRRSKVAPRVEVARSRLLDLTGRQELVTKDDMLSLAGEDFDYRDIGRAAESLIAEGLVNLSYKGRTRCWSKVTQGESQVPHLPEGELQNLLAQLNADLQGEGEESTVTQG
jgi:hypothetical protein